MCLTIYLLKDIVWFYVVVQLLSRVQLFVTPRTAAHQAPLSSIISQNLLRFMSIESVMPPNHLILCCPLLLLPQIFPSTRAFSNELTLRIRWPKYCSFSISPSNEYSGWISLELTGLSSLCSWDSKQNGGFFEAGELRVELSSRAGLNLAAAEVDVSSELSPAAEQSLPSNFWTLIPRVEGPEIPC